MVPDKHQTKFQFLNNCFGFSSFGVWFLVFMPRATVGDRYTQDPRSMGIFHGLPGGPLISRPTGHTIGPHPGRTVSTKEDDDRSWVQSRRM
jgi:hypothetical protein